MNNCITGVHTTILPLQLQKYINNKLTPKPMMQAKSQQKNENFKAPTIIRALRH
jgi:hypothetical protein